MNTLEILNRFKAEMKFARNGLVFYLPGNRTDAERFVELATDNIVTSLKKMNLQFANICYRNMRKPIRLCVEMVNGLNTGEKVMTQSTIIAVPSIQVAEQKLSAPTLKVLNNFCEYPENLCALVRVHDERQVALTASSAALIKGATLEEAVRRKRQDYWYLPDLTEFQRESRQRLEPNNENSFIEFSWRGVSKDSISWRQFITKYRLIQDVYGIMYHVTKNLGVEICTTPYTILK